MKTPISYYGGKQNLVNTILPYLETPHTQYVEPFFGGGAIFFAKRPSETECINDLNGWVYTFFQQLRDNYEELNRLIQFTMHCEKTHRQAKAILKGEVKATDVYIAWAFWVQTNMSFANALFKGFAFDNNGKSPLNSKNKRLNFSKDLSDRLSKVEIFNRDAIDLIERKDTPTTLFYFDPPYPESDCGHYNKGADVYYDLLALLPTLKGKFIMSSYPSNALSAVRLKNGFFSSDTQDRIAVNGKHTQGKKKTECLTFNFEKPQGLLL